MFTDTAKLIEWLRESNRHFKKTKLLSRKTREYYNGDQLDNWIKNVLANRGQPEQYENQIAKHNNSILGFKQERETQITLFGTQQRDRAGADLLNAIIKSITQISDYDDQVNAMDDELSIEGLAVAELTIKASGEFDRFGREHKDVEINHVPHEETFLDPFSKNRDYNKDARYLTRAFWTDKEDLYGLGFPEDKISQLNNTNFASDVLEDDLYADESIRDRVLLVYTWYRQYDREAKKDKFYYVFWSGTVILLQGESPYEFDGFPYEVQFLGRDTNAKAEIRYWGLYRDIMPLQDAINHAKLRLGNMLGNNKLLVERGALIDEDIVGFTAEYSLDNSVVMVENIAGFKDVRQNAQIQQILSTIIDNRNQISELLNSNKEMLGTANNRMSQVGQEQRIETGLVGLSRFMKGSERLQKKIVKKMVSMIGQYYDTERVVSIIDEDYMQDFITVNQPQTNPNGSVDFEMLPDGKVKPIVANSLVIGKYDLIYTTKPKSTSMSSERLRQNVELMKVLERIDPQLVTYIVPDILRDSDSPSAKKVRDFIERRDQERNNSPMAQQNAQLQADNARLEMMFKQSQTNLNNTKSQSMIDRNKIDLQKAFSRSLIDRQIVQAKNDKNQLDAMRRIS
jgi:hypothetical protein